MEGCCGRRGETPDVDIPENLFEPNEVVKREIAIERALNYNKYHEQEQRLSSTQRAKSMTPPLSFTIPEPFKIEYELVVQYRNEQTNLRVYTRVVLPEKPEVSQIVCSSPEETCENVEDGIFVVEPDSERSNCESSDIAQILVDAAQEPLELLEDEASELYPRPRPPSAQQGEQQRICGEPCDNVSGGLHEASEAADDNIITQIQIPVIEHAGTCDADHVTTPERMNDEPLEENRQLTLQEPPALPLSALKAVPRTENLEESIPQPLRQKIVRTPPPQRSTRKNFVDINIEEVKNYQTPNRIHIPKRKRELLWNVKELDADCSNSDEDDRYLQDMRKSREYYERLRSRSYRQARAAPARVPGVQRLQIPREMYESAVRTEYCDRDLHRQIYGQVRRGVGTEVEKAAGERTPLGIDLSELLRDLVLSKGLNEEEIQLKLNRKKQFVDEANDLQAKIE